MSSFTRTFTKLATAISRWAGRPMVFCTCVVLVVLWGASGPLFGFSDTWQLVINTSTTIITFLMVFLIQNTQNRDNNAIQAKLDELIRASASHNSFIGIENLPDEELEAILAECDKHSTRLRDEARKELKSRGETAPSPTPRKPAAKRATSAARARKAR